MVIFHFKLKFTLGSNLISFETPSKHQVVLFMEESEDAWITPLKIGNLFFNRFGVDEDAAFEMVGVYHLRKSSRKMAYPYDEEYKNFENERKEKGMDINHIYDRNHFKSQIIVQFTYSLPIF